ncbi:hypothetical protein O181_070508 [Austropuccinia psidii MF-1]|uniref:Uncharacterized protein n=1 Tax=Austropuccinia psidii MF-1 TaxID=1389203 RepID=A0A9Q3EZ87_9BASI|nr:hypothetical protein [Austropuccinia psidii MF-1]
MDNDILTLVSEETDEIYLYSGAFSSVVNQLGYLSNIVQVKRQVNTYSEPANITYQGMLVFRQIHVSPVYFAPKGKVNLLIEQIVPFGVEEVFRDENPVSKVRSVGWSIKALTFEPYSDALRGLDPNTGKVKITCNYFQLISETSVDIRKDHSLPPGSPIESPCQPVTFTLPKIGKSHTSHPNQVPHHADLPHNNGSPSSATSHSVRQSGKYNYVPFYDTAPINISCETSPQIIEGPKDSGKLLTD